MDANQLIDAPSTQTLDAVMGHYAVQADDGLSESEVRQRLERFGENRMRESAQRSALSILVDQFESVIVLLLVAASGLAFAFGDVVEGIAIIAVILVNAAIGFFTELRAVRSMEALQELGQVKARVRREGSILEIDATEIVPGDLLVLEGGDIIAADARLLEAAKLQANESALTGEAVPVDKHIEPLDAEAELAERTNMVFKGTAITRGSGEAVVVATGMDTELGRISELVEEAEDETTPLEQRLDQLGQKLVWLTILVAVFVVIAGVISGKDLRLMLETAIVLAVASVPEGLPIVSTIALARGMQRMVKRNALLNSLSTVETLGATNVICTDKTGTLTENKMHVAVFQFDDRRVDLDDEAAAEAAIVERALRIGVLCNNADMGRERPDDAVGEPLEVALLQGGARYDLFRADLLEAMPETREVAFDTETMMMATFHEHDDGQYVAVKGAPEGVLAACARVYTDGGETGDLSETDREQWRERNSELAGEGLRMLALADKTTASVDDDPYTDLTFVGLVGLLDPPRANVAETIRKCQRAGIRVIMVTGDQSETARNIGIAVGLVESDTPDVVRGEELRETDDGSGEMRQRMLNAAIFARVNPEQKLDIIQLHQDDGKRVAMTGDGVNDAPALKKADIGIAMGERGTQVAKDTADMVLQDDSLSTIIMAVEQGRVIFGNIRKFMIYLLSCNLSGFLVVSVASLFNVPLPITPLQILFLNLVTDVFPALALGMGEGDETVIEQPPRDPQEPVMRGVDWARTAFYSGMISLGVLLTFAITLEGLTGQTELAVTVAFLTLAFGRLWNVFNVRDADSSLISNAITRNPLIWAALVLCIVLILLATYLPFMQTLLTTVNPGPEGWALVIAGSTLPLIVGQIVALGAAQIKQRREAHDDRR